MYVYDSTASNSCQMDNLVKKLKPKKEWAQKLSGWLDGLMSEEQAARWTHCGDYLTMLANEDMTRRKIETAYFCDIRLCPGCAWRASLQSAACVSAIAAKLTGQKKIMLFVTLTIPNVRADQLRAACLKLNADFYKMIKRKRYHIWKDNIRKLEITYNAARDDYHPHLHVIVFVSSTYFKGGGGYISHDTLLDDWRATTGDYSITQVDVRRCKDKDSGSNAILEVAKYSAKAADYTHSESVFRTMYATMYHLRTMTYSGVCKTLRADFDAGRLDDMLPRDTTRYVWRLVYQFYAGQGYVQTDTMEYVEPAPAGFGELVGGGWDWDGLAADMAEVT